MMDIAELRLTIARVWRARRRTHLLKWAAFWILVPGTMILISRWG